MTAHCCKNNPRVKTESVTAGIDVTVYSICFTVAQIPVYNMAHINQTYIVVSTPNVTGSSFMRRLVLFVNAGISAGNLLFYQN